MALLSYYDIGFASVANGSTAVTGASTQWLTALRENDVFVGADGRTARIASIESATSMTLARAWPGDSQTSDVYEVRITPAPSEITASVRELLEKLRQGLWLTPNATGTLAERAGYDSARRGFIYMQTDVDPFVVFVKQTDTAGDWSPGFSPQQGPSGPFTTIEIGTVTTLAPDDPATIDAVQVGDTVTLNFGIPAGEGFYFKGTYSAAVTYSKDDVVFYNGSAFIANVTTQANTPDPTQNTAAWSRLALRGNDGDITGVTPFWAGRIQVDADAAAARTGLDVPSTDEVADGLAARVAVDESQNFTLAEQGLARRNIGAGVLAGFRNKIINGRFLVTTRGSGGTLAPGASAFITDRWLVQNGTNQTLTYSIASSLPYNRSEEENRVAFSFSVAPTSGDVFLYQKIEDVRTLAGRTVTSFCRVLDVGILSGAFLVSYLSQSFGLGGSADVVSTPQAMASSIGSQRSVHELASVAGKTIGTGNCLNAIWRFTPRSTGLCVLTEFGVVEGDATSEPNPFAPRHIQQEMALCQRYYSEAVVFAIQTASAASQYLSGTLVMPVTMRAAPSVTHVAEGGVTNSNVGTVNIDNISANGARVFAQSLAAGSAAFGRRVTMNSEL